MILYAAELATDLHKNQMYGDKPYITHVTEVVEQIIKHSSENNELAINIGYLHDVVEDTEYTIQDIEDVFGPDIMMGVKLCTDPEAKYREDRKKLLYRQLDYYVDDEDCDLQVLRATTLVKCADRFCNQRKSITSINVSKLSMYVTEFPEFMRHFGIHIAPFYPVLWNDLMQQYLKMNKLVDTYR